MARCDGLKWHWDPVFYRSMLQTSGEKTALRLSYGTGARHAEKTEIFADPLRTTSIFPRPGVAESFKLARGMGLRTAMVSTTDRLTLDLALKTKSYDLAELFDLVTSADDGIAQKPAADAYLSVLGVLGVAPAFGVAIGTQTGHSATALASDLAEQTEPSRQ